MSAPAVFNDIPQENSFFEDDEGWDSDSFEVSTDEPAIADKRRKSRKSSISESLQSESSAADMDKEKERALNFNVQVAVILSWHRKALRCLNAAIVASSWWFLITKQMKFRGRGQGKGT